MEHSLEPAHRALAANPVIAGVAQAEFRASLASGRELIAAMQKELLDAPYPQMRPDAFYRLGTVAVESQFKLFDVMLPVLQGVVEKSVAESRNALRARIAVCCLVSVVVLPVLGLSYT